MDIFPLAVRNQLAVSHHGFAIDEHVPGQALHLHAGIRGVITIMRMIGVGNAVCIAGIPYHQIRSPA